MSAHDPHEAWLVVQYSKLKRTTAFRTKRDHIFDILVKRSNFDHEVVGWLPAKLIEKRLFPTSKKDQGNQYCLTIRIRSVMEQGIAKRNALESLL